MVSPASRLVVPWLVALLLLPTLQAQEPSSGRGPETRSAREERSETETRRARARSGLSRGQVRQVVVLILGLGLCCGWFTLVAVSHKRRALAEEAPEVCRKLNTKNFFTFGLAALPSVLTPPTAEFGKEGSKKKKAKTRGKEGEEDKIEWDENEVIFLSTEGQKREAGLGEATNASRDIILGAVKKQATDIHLEPKGSSLQIRYRVDGELQNAATYDPELGISILAALKVASEMDIAEKRKPQDGSFVALVNKRMVDFRVATAPSAYGEKMVIRVLDKTTGVKRLDDLGFQPEVLRDVRRVINMPHGMLIVCGPTGSGKSTTLYAAISELDATKMNVITIENPIEYHLPNVNQTPINEKAGVTFASVLRSSLRQDPDVLMVGEIRDKETAQVAMQAAMTGHLVFSTLHANDSTSSVFRLLDLELEPFMVSSALTAVLAQRLVRRLCDFCKQPYQPSKQFILMAEKQGMNISQFYRGLGCEKCNFQGYRGRMGVFEMLMLNDRIRALIQKKPSIVDIQEAARKTGMMYLREDALLKAAQGMTTVEQVLMVTK